MKKGETTTGFTIIEVSLTIAIAGIIFLMVFVALPWLRATQKDTKRREDLIHFISEVKTFQQKNRGTLPGKGDSDNTIAWSDADNENALASSWQGFYRDYLKEKFMDPDGVNYQLEIKGCNKSVAGQECEINREEIFYPNDYKIIVVPSAVCSNERPVQSSNIRKLAAMYALESGGFYCVNT